MDDVDGNLQNGVAYSVREYADMVLTYGLANLNAAAAARLYAERFPDRRHPRAQVFRRVVRRMEEDGNLLPLHLRGPGQGVVGRPRVARNVNNEELVLGLVEENPTISQRQIEARTGIRRTTVNQILKDNGYHPYHYTRVHHIYPDDEPRLVGFAQAVLAMLRVDPDLLEWIMFTDESPFSRDARFNLHNEHFYALENPHVYIVNNHQQRFFINVWAAIVGDVVIGPVEFPDRLGAAEYTAFLRGPFRNWVQQFDVDMEHIFHQHDNAPPHTARVTQQLLNRMFPGRLIGRGGVLRWPARSPDLNPLDFFLWGFVESHVYATEVNTREELWGRIQEAFARITPQMLQNVRADFRRRMEALVHRNGGIIEPWL